MATPQVLYSPQARADLTAIEAYIAANDGQERAVRIGNRLRAAARTLAHMPGMGKSRPYLAPTVRAFPVSPWTIICKPLQELDGIFVYRVLDGRRDLPEAFG